MAEQTNISWCDHTFNSWRGCTKVSEGCRNCYAESNSRRNLPMFGEWGPNGTRVVAAEAGWKEPVKWNKKNQTETLKRESVVDAWRAVGGLLYCESCKAIHPDNEQAKTVYQSCGCGRLLSEMATAIPEQVGEWIIVRSKVFCASLADVFEEWTGGMINSKGETLHRTEAWYQEGYWVPAGDFKIGKSVLKMDDVRLRLMRLAAQTRWLDWLLLTKRPENVSPMLGRIGAMVDTNEKNRLAESWVDNVWLGTSVEDQQTGNYRIPHLLNNPAKFHFLSCEPLLKPFDPENLRTENGTLNAFTNELVVDTPNGEEVRKLVGGGVDWVIVGGESGSNARPMNLDWARSLRDQCKRHGVAFFFKQMGGKSDKGEDFDKIPEDLRIREFPKVRA